MNLSNWTEEEIKLFNSKQRPGRRSKALVKLAYTCLEHNLSNKDSLDILLDADDRWGKFRTRSDRRVRLQAIINHCESTQDLYNETK